MAIPLIVRIYRRADLSISFRPSGRPEAGHFQTASLAMLKDIAEHGRLPDFPPGWWVTVEGGKAVSVQETRVSAKTPTAAPRQRARPRPWVRRLWRRGGRLRQRTGMTPDWHLCVCGARL